MRCSLTHTLSFLCEKSFPIPIRKLKTNSSIFHARRSYKGTKVLFTNFDDFYLISISFHFVLSA